LVVVAQVPVTKRRRRSHGLPDHRGAEGAEGLDYPASKQELASHAERNGGGRELVEALRSMNADSFDGPNAVMKELKGSLTGSGD
jgi:hypothetical protein